MNNVIMRIFCLISFIAGTSSSIFEQKNPTKNVRALQSNDSKTRFLQSSTTIGFDLYNTVTDVKIATLTNDTVVNLNGIGSVSALNIEGVTTGTKPASIKFSLDVSLFNRIEGGTRYSMCGNSGSDFKSCNGMTLGKHIVQATVYSGKNATGQILGTNAVRFELVDFPVTTPTNPVTANPVPSPVLLPATKSPVNPSPTKRPVTTAPVNTAPTVRPVTTAPVNPAPTTSPVTKVPVNPSLCRIPKINGTWVSWPKYPIPIGESEGGMVGDHFVIVAGFTKSFSETTKRVFAFDTRNLTGLWQEKDEVPVPGFSHAAVAVDGLIMYVCGAYVGPTPGLDSPICLKYTHTNPPTQQWSRLPDMPDGRGGGAVNHIKESNSLIYTAGATRRGTTIDFNSTWELDLNNITAGWVVRPELPFKGNHISHVTAKYNGNYRYYVAGGQLQQQEKAGNQDSLFEWDAINKVWIRRAKMKIARGHATSSTIPYGCGFIMAGGATNNGTHTDDISYYGSDTDSWVTIGRLPQAINSPVCDIVRKGPGDDWVYCQTGNVGGSFSVRTQISL